MLADSVSQHRHMNILIVDDEKIELESLRRGMRCEGHTVFEAGDGCEAMRLLDEHHEAIDIVLTDYYMPVMNGIELLKEIRFKYGSVPVIMLTAYGSTTVKREALLNGCSAVIEKPFTMRQLNRHFERLDHA